MQPGFTASEIVKQYKLSMDAAGSGGSRPDALRARERCAMPRRALAAPGGRLAGNDNLENYLGN